MIRVLVLFVLSILIFSCSNRTKEVFEDKSIKEGELIKEFRKVETNLSSLEESMAKVRAKFEIIKDSILKDIKGKNQESYSKALISDSITQDFIKYVKALKEKVENDAKGNTDIETHYQLLITNGKGKELKDYINSTREHLLTLLTIEEQKNIKSDLIAKDPSENQTWESNFFEHSPAAAVLMLLEKIMNDAVHTNLAVIIQLAKREN